MTKNEGSAHEFATADLGALLASARSREAVKDAEGVMCAATKRQEAHRLSADDLVWLVEQVGAWESSWGAGQAIAQWLFHHGPVHPQLVATAVDIAEYDNAEWLDDVLLWIEPTADRWFQHALWSASFTWRELRYERGRAGLTVPSQLTAPADVALFQAVAMKEPAAFARRVLAERGDAARRALRAAPEIAPLGKDVRLVLSAWAEGLS